MTNVKMPIYLKILYVISFIIFLGCLIFSFFRLSTFSNINNIPEIQPDNVNEIKGEFLRVNIAKVDILPIAYEGIFNGKVIIIAHITSTNGAKFITPLTQEKILKEKIEPGNTLIFGERDHDANKIEKKKYEIFNAIKIYPEFDTKSFLFLQGTAPDYFTIFGPVIYGLVAIGIAYRISSLVMRKKIKNAFEEERRSKIISESLSPEIAQSLMIKK